MVAVFSVQLAAIRYPFNNYCYNFQFLYMADNQIKSERQKDKENTSSKSRYRVKDLPMDMEFPEEEDEPPTFEPAALELHKVGNKLPSKRGPSEPVQELNDKGTPARIRKKNTFIFVEDFVNPSPSQQTPKKTPKILSITHSKPPRAKKQKFPSKIQRDSEKSEDKSENGSSNANHRIGKRLRNLLKLPKAHKWVCFEYFYSNIDKALFDGQTDFMTCLKKSFPQLTNCKLTKIQWSKIKKMMGKPSRLSQSFFEEQRKDLESKRKLIRYIQQTKMADIEVEHLPNEIPMQLVVGTKVTARLRKPQDGLFMGIIDGVDTLDNTYRITFERPTIGTHSVPDYEVLSNDPPNTMNLASMAQKLRPQNVSPEVMSWSHTEKINFNCLRGDPMIGCSDVEQANKRIGIYPFSFLKSIAKIKKILCAKEIQINRLKDYNSEAEIRKSNHQNLPEDFEHNYAVCLIFLEKLNIKLQRHMNETREFCEKIDPGPSSATMLASKLQQYKNETQEFCQHNAPGPSSAPMFASKVQQYKNETQEFCQKIAPGPSSAAMLAPSHLRKKCQEDANIIVERNNTEAVKDPKIIGLITDLTALMLQVKTQSDSDQNAYEPSVLQGTIDQIKMKLDPKHKKLFESHIETQMRKIQIGLGLKKSN